MALGSVRSVLVCDAVPVATEQDVAICGPAVGGQSFAPRLVSGYLINPDQVGTLEAATGPFDYGYASQVWAFGFSTVVVLYVSTHYIAQVIRFLRTS